MDETLRQDAQGRVPDPRRTGDGGVSLRSYVAMAPNSIAMFDTEMRYLAASQRWLAAYGGAAGTLIGRCHYDLHPDLPEAWRAAHRSGLAGTPIERRGEVWTRADGTRYWIDWSIVPWRDADGTIGGIVISTEDVTDRRRAEAALRESEARLAAIIDSAMDAIISIDAGHRVRVFNPAAAQMFGISATAAIGRPISSFLPERHRANHDAQIDAFARGEGGARRMGRRVALTGLRANGEEFEIEASISAAADSLCTVILHDVTARRQSERALIELRAEMDEMLALHVAAQTAAAIAHEINQPLSAVATYGEAATRMLQAGNPEPERVLRALQASGEQAQRAGKRVRELIDFLHRGETAPEAVDLNAAVRRAVNVVEANGYGGFAARIELDPALRPVRANRLHVEKILVNLLRNGVEAMRNAGVRTQSIAIVVRTADDGRMAQVTVQDTGPGIDREAARRVFEPFFTTKPRGIGMGLAISRALVEANGGQLWLDLDAGPGATFHFTLPFMP